MQIKSYHNGTHRYCSPEHTMQKIQPFLRKMGITRVANLTGLDDINIPVISVYRPNSKSLATTQGKGHSVIAAKVSGIMESIETYHAENITINTTLDCFKNTENAIHYSNLALSSHKDFNDDTVIKWATCKNIRNGEEASVPYELIHTEFTIPTSKDTGYFIADSNGLASGNTITEAINHGLYEVIERDAITLWQLTPTDLHHKNRIDIDSIHDEYLKDLLNKIDQTKIHIGIWDITSDINIPTFLCKIVSKDNIGIRPAYGSGTHLNKNVALSRAITEAVQSRITFIAGARDDQYHNIYEDEISPDVYNFWLNELTDIRADQIKSFDDVISTHFNTLDEDQQCVLNRLNNVGIKDAFFVDLTKPEYNIPVVKVIIPGTEGLGEGERLLGQRGINFYNKYGVGACKIE